MRIFLKSIISIRIFKGHLKAVIVLFKKMSRLIHIVYITYAHYTISKKIIPSRSSSSIWWSRPISSSRPIRPSSPSRTINCNARIVEQICYRPTNWPIDRMCFVTFKNVFFLFSMKNFCIIIQNWNFFTIYLLDIF